MNRTLLVAKILVTSLAVIGAAHAAGDAARGKARSASCTPCHGANGQGVPPNPPLAGVPEARQVQALKDYKSGARPNPIMRGLAASLSEQDMEDLAAYYASIN
jgi:cytochrome c553